MPKKRVSSMSDAEKQVIVHAVEKGSGKHPAIVRLLSLVQAKVEGVVKLPCVEVGPERHEIETAINLYLEIKSTKLKVKLVTQKEYERELKREIKRDIENALQADPYFSKIIDYLEKNEKRDLQIAVKGNEGQLKKVQEVVDRYLLMKQARFKVHFFNPTLENLRISREVLTAHAHLPFFKDLFALAKTDASGMIEVDSSKSSLTPELIVRLEFAINTVLHHDF